MDPKMSSDDSKAPFFSVIMPCFNSQAYIEESVRSILNQSEQDFEIIIVDDGSTDGSETVVQNLVTEDSRVRFIKNDRTSGASGARNCGVYVSRGEWICFLDSDDLFLSHCLGFRKDVIKKNLDIQFFSSDFFRWVDCGPDKVRQSQENDHWNSVFSECKDCTVIKVDDPLSLFLKGVVAWTGGVTMHRQLFMDAGGFNETLKRAEDHHLWFRCAALSGKMGLVRSADSIYRIRSSGLSGGINRLTSYSIYMYRLMERDSLFSGVKGNIKEKIHNHHYMLSVEARGDGRWCRAIKHSLLYWLKSPLQKRAIRNFVASLLLRP